MWLYLLLILVTVIFTLQSLFAKMYSDHHTGQSCFSSPVFSVIYGFFCAIATVAMNGFVYQPSVETLLLGLVNGVVVFFYNFSLIESSRRGPYSFLMICNLFGGLLVPMFVSLVFYDQKLSVFQWIGVGVMLVAFVLLNLKGENQEKPKRFFYFWSILLGVVNGLYGSILNVQSELFSGGERSEMVTTTFFSLGVLSLGYLALISRKQFFSAFKVGKKSLLFALGACASATAAANLLLYLLSQMNPTVIYVTDLGGVLALSVLASVILFKDRMNRFQIVGTVLCLFAIAIMNF